MPASKSRATISTIDFGSFQIQGLMLVDGSYAVAVSQVAELFFVGLNNHTKQVKALLGGDSQLVQVTSELNSKPVNVVSLTQFETLIVELTIKGNLKAIELSRLSIGLALVQRFSDSFGIAFEKSDRDDWLKARAKGKVVRLGMTDAVQGWIAAHPEISQNEAKFMYANASDTLNRLLTGHTSKYWCDLRSLERYALRDDWGSGQLSRIEEIERLAGRKMAKGLHPVEAIEQAIDALEHEVWTEDDLFGTHCKTTQTRNRNRKLRAA